MKVNQKTDEQQLKEEIRYAKEALAIVSSASTHTAVEHAYNSYIPIEYCHLVEKRESELRIYISRLKSDLKDLQRGDFE